MNGRRARARARFGSGPELTIVDAGRVFRREYYRIPRELLLAGLVLRGLARGAWWTLRVAVAHWRLTALALAAGWVWRNYGLDTLRVTTYLLVTVAAVAGCVWWWRAPASFVSWVTSPVLGRWRWHTRYAQIWREAMHGCSLMTVRDGIEYIPQVDRVRSGRNLDRLTVRLASGQTPEVFAGKGEALRHVVGAHRVDVRSTRPGWLTVTITRHDPLADPVTVRHPAYHAALRESHERAAQSPEGALDLLDEGVPVALTETGQVWRLPIRGGHTLVAGTTGAGKSSLVWAVLLGLAPLIRSGFVTVTGLDPKLMELAPARGLVDVHTDVPAMPTLLADLVSEMDQRCADLQRTGHRVHQPSTTSPHRVVIVDELATLTALTDRRSKEAVENALGALQSRGRAAGFTVLVTTVEPTKEVVRWRGLYLHRIGFRLDETSHVDMTLGDGARDRGATCDLIDPALPGVGFVRVEGDPTALRVRVVHVTDHDIDTLTTQPVGPGLIDLTASEPGTGIPTDETGGSR